MAILEIGFESEFLWVTGKHGIIVPPSYIPKDDFVLLGEVRGAPGRTPGEAVGNYWKEYHRIQDLRSKYVIANKDSVEIQHLAHKFIDRDLYRRALGLSNLQKEQVSGDILNIRGIDIGDFSDLVVKDGKMTGAHISCGLHVHFSAHADYGIEKVELPKAVKDMLVDHYLYRKASGIKGASLLTRPSIVEITKKMDSLLFKSFAPDENHRTKYRQPGFIELKPYGFEYRSLPASDATIKDLLPIAKTAFSLLEKAVEWHSNK